MPDKSRYKCACCGKLYDSLPLCFGSDYPYHYFSIPIEEREQRIELEESLCVIDGEHFFHRGRFTIPIIDYDDDLIFNVWTSINADNFGLRMDLWNDSGRVNQEPYFGWLQTLIPGYGQTLNFKTIAIEQEVGLIPEIKSIENGNKLTIDQENGITYLQAVEIVDNIMRQEHKGS